MVLEAVAAAEAMQASDEEVNTKIEEIAKNYGMEVDQVKETFGEDEMNQMKEDIKVEKAVNFVTEKAVEK